jgi:transcriptional regulator with XRE-family HTH domain
MSAGPNEKLKRQRQLRGWSQAYLGELLGVADYYISRWERGENAPSMFYQQKLCQIFALTAEELGLLQADNAHLDTSSNNGSSLTVEPYSPMIPPLVNLPTTTDVSRQTTLPGLPESPTKMPQPPRVVLLLLLVLLLVLASSIGIFTWLHLRQASPSSATPVPVGYLHFESSGQTNETSNQGVADLVQMTLRSFHPPAAGKSDYAWLLPDSDQPENPALLLGIVSSNGTLTYSDREHTNLLDSTSRFLVTEEDAAIPPLFPSTDRSTWLYTGQIPHSVPAHQQYSYLDHLRHLLTSDPKLHAIHLSGGLVLWCSRNMQAIDRWALSAQGDWQTRTPPDPFAMRQDTVRILDYLDGIDFVGADLPASVSSPVLVDERIGRIGLLEVSRQQEPPAYIDHIVLHLNGLLASPGADPSLQVQIAQIIRTMNVINTWLQHLRQDAMRILALTDQQVQKLAPTILNDMVMTATDASNGKTDPVTGSTQQGVSWVSNAIGNLAQIPILPYNT